MSFTKKDGDRLFVLLLSNWGICAVGGWIISVIADRSALNAFIVMFAVCIAALVVMFLARRDLLSSLLLIGGGLLAFSLTVFVFKLLGL